ncbi:hypothetical protein BH09MYX1_BH09MYX1_49720 [soil metagenome]
MGAGAIGCYLGGALAARGHDVRFVGRDRVGTELRATFVIHLWIPKDPHFAGDFTESTELM